MVKCVFCGREEYSFKGIHVIKNTGTVNYFCSSKCRKNSEKLGRDKRNVRWTEAFHATRDKTRAKESAAQEKAKEKKKE
jgi:large subunit ribosomal protein L24e